MDLFSDIITQRRTPRKTVNVSSESSNEARENRENRIKVAAYEQAIEEYQALVEECNKTLAEVRRLSLKCVETNEATNQLVQAGVEKFDTFEPSQVREDYAPSVTTGISEESINDIKSAIDSKLAGISESVNSGIEASMAGVNANIGETLSAVKADIGSVMTNVKNNMNESMDSLKSDMDGAMEAMMKDMSGKLEEQEGYIHKENIRVYRNVQAALVDELKQQTEALSAQNTKLEKKLKGSKAISIIALVFSAITMVGVIAGLVMDIFGIVLKF